jgi:hypothetical protein
LVVRGRYWKAQCLDRMSGLVGLDTSSDRTCPFTLRHVLTGKLLVAEVAESALGGEPRVTLHLHEGMQRCWGSGWEWYVGCGLVALSGPVLTLMPSLPSPLLTPTRPPAHPGRHGGRHVGRGWPNVIACGPSQSPVPVPHPRRLGRTGGNHQGALLLVCGEPLTVFLRDVVRCACTPMFLLLLLLFVCMIDSMR